jgi:hypothetical protein
MFGKFKKSNIQRNNIYIIFFGVKKNNFKSIFIEMINVLHF